MLVGDTSEGSGEEGREGVGEEGREGGGEDAGDGKGEGKERSLRQPLLRRLSSLALLLVLDSLFQLRSPSLSTSLSYFM